jgi:hypothetical protein
MRSLGLFSVIAVLHFVLSVAGILAALPAGFDAQAGFWAAPGKAILVWTSTALLAPLDWIRLLLPVRSNFGYSEIAVISVLYGAAAVGVARLWRAVKVHRGNDDLAS